MTFGTTNIFKISIKMRKLLRISQYTISVRLINKSYVKCITKEAGYSNILEPQIFDFEKTFNKTQQKDRYNFEQCKHNSEVFKLIRKSKSLTSTHAVNALEVLYKLNQKNADDVSSLKQRKEFTELCQIINNDMQKLSSVDLIKVFKIVINFKFKLPFNILNSVIEKLSQSLNNLSLDQITFLIFLLSKTTNNSPKIEALKIAMSIVLKCYENTNPDSENINSLVYSLKYLSWSNIDEEFASIIIKALNKYSDFDSKQSTNILMSLCTFKNKNEDAELVEKVGKIVTKNVNEINSSKLEFIAKKVVNKIKHGDNYFYNDKLIEAIVQTLISRDRGVHKSLDILSHLTSISFTSLQLLDYIFDKFYKYKSVIDKIGAFEISQILSAMSLANYKPIFWNSLKNLLLTDKVFQLKHSLLIRIALYLAALDHYWPKLLDRVFQHEKFNKQLEITFERRYKKYILLLHYAVSTFYPDYTGPLLSDEVIQKFRDSLLLEEEYYFPLKSALELSLGGPQYVKTHIITDFAYDIDHLVIMRKGGFPIAINNEEEPSALKLSDIRPIPGSQVLLFVYIFEKSYVRNTKNFTGLQLLKMKMYKLKPNYTVIPIFSDMWTNLTVPKQIQYITQVIKQKNDEFPTNYY